MFKIILSENLPDSTFIYSKQVKNRSNVLFVRNHNLWKPPWFDIHILTQLKNHSNAIFVQNYTHTAENPFKCNFCLKSFSQKAYLRNHSYTHIAQKLFKCNIFQNHLLGKTTWLYILILRELKNHSNVIFVYNHSQ